MQKLLLSLAALLLAGPVPVSADYDQAAPDVPVALMLNEDLLRQAKAQGLDLSALLKAQLVTALEKGAKASTTTHASVQAKAFDSFEAIAFAPLEVDASTPVDEVKVVCQSVRSNIETLIAQAQARNALPAPTSIEDIARLNEEGARRYTAFEAKRKTELARMRTSGPILDRHCPQIKQRQAELGQAVKEVIKPYDATGWCKAKMRQPQSAWSMQDSTFFVKMCQGVKAG